MESKQPLVSIALVNYQNAPYLGENIEGILAQTYPNIEVIIADDGSTDGSLEIIEQYALKYDRINVFSAVVNRGIPKTSIWLLVIVKANTCVSLQGTMLCIPKKSKNRWPIWKITWILICVFTMWMFMMMIQEPFNFNGWLSMSPQGFHPTHFSGPTGFFGKITGKHHPAPGL